MKINLYSPGELSISGVVHSKTLNQATPTIISGGNPNTEEHLKAVQEHLLQNTQWGDIILFNHADQFRFLKKRKDKGLSIALEAVKKIGCKLVLAGPEHQTSFCNELINDSSVIYLGELSYQELFAEYQKSKAQIYLTQYVEPFGLSVIEAMAAGSPVITTGLGGTGDTVIHGKTGFHAKTVDEVVSAYHALNQISSQDCINQARNYSPENMAKAYFEIFTTRNHALKPGKNI
ncbi:MAG: glycosyltransferase [Reinekea sp.]